MQYVWIILKVIDNCSVTIIYFEYYGVRQSLLFYSQKFP